MSHNLARKALVHFQLMSQDHHNSKRRFLLPSFPLDRLTFSAWSIIMVPLLRDFKSRARSIFACGTSQSLDPASSPIWRPDELLSHTPLPDRCAGLRPGEPHMGLASNFALLLVGRSSRYGTGEMAGQEEDLVIRP